MNVSGVSLTHIKHEEVWRRMPVKNQFRCPKCASIVYSRKSRCCGVCGITLPESFAFSIEETEALKSLLESEREQHKAWLSKRENEGIYALRAS